MEITSSDKRLENKSELSSGIDSYMEDQTLSEDISRIMGEKNSFTQLKKLKELHTSYRTDLSRSHIDYHRKAIKRNQMHTLASFACMIIIISHLLLALFYLQKFYTRYFNLGSSQATLQSAIEYYNAGDYESAQPRYEVLINNDWHDYIIYRDLNYIYQSQNLYDQAANLLLDYLTTYYGWANISPENDALIILQDLSSYSQLSAATSERIRSITESVNDYNELYLQLFEHIENGEYSEASYLCQTLKTVGASGFYYASCYSNVLINTGKIDEAYEYIMKLVRDDVTAHTRIIPPSQRRALVNYIIPYLNDEQVADCENYLHNELETQNLSTEPPYAEPYISYENTASVFESEISRLNYLSSIDSIQVSEDTTMINARECYYIRTSHIDASNKTYQYFFMDMNRNLSMFLDGKYIDLPKDQPYDIDTYKYDNFSEYLFHHSEYPEIEITIKNGGSDTCICSIQNTSLGETYFQDIALSYSEYHAFAYGEENGFKFTCIFSQKDLIFLIKEDLQQKYSFLEGRYALKNN